MSAQLVDCSVDFDASNLAGKTAVVTGGASGLGQAYVRALIDAKVKVCFGDINAVEGKKLSAELAGSKFVPCDVTQWEQQKILFQEATSLSSDGRIDYVVANAGIARKDDVFANDGSQKDLEEPDLSIVNINLRAVLFTVKLAMHYFVKQNGTKLNDSQTDTCLVLIGSGAAYLDVPRGPQYSATKWAMRGIMHSMRKTAFHYGSRINMISPWYVNTNILSKDTFERVKESGVEFAEADDGGQCLLRILSDHRINGRSLFVAARKWAPRGYMDLGLDDLPQDGLLIEIQADQIKPAPVELGLFAL